MLDNRFHPTLYCQLALGGRERIENREAAEGVLF